MLWIRTCDLAAGTKDMRVSRLRMFLEEQREDGLAGLPPAAVIHVGEVPFAGYRLPRRLERRIFDQFVDPANLALLPVEQHRTVMLLLAYTGCGCRASRRLRATRSSGAAQGISAIIRGSGRAHRRWTDRGARRRRR